MTNCQYAFDEWQEFFCTPQGEEMYHTDVVEALNSLLAVVKITQISLGMTVPELLRVVAKDIATDEGIEAIDILAMWLRRTADELEKTLAALPKHLKG